MKWLRPLLVILLFLAPFERVEADPGDLFNSVDSAAIDAGAFARNQPKDFIEYGGWIYRAGNCYGYSFILGGPHSLEYDKLEKLRTADGVAIWHSHPGTKGSSPDLPVNFFSGLEGDKGMAQSFGVPLYLNTPSLENKVYNPKSKIDKTLSQLKARKCSAQNGQ